MKVETVIFPNHDATEILVYTSLADTRQCPQEGTWESLSDSQIQRLA